VARVEGDRGEDLVVPGGPGFAGGLSERAGPVVFLELAMQVREAEENLRRRGREAVRGFERRERLAGPARAPGRARQGLPGVEHPRVLARAVLGGNDGPLLAVSGRGERGPPLDGGVSRAGPPVTGGPF